MDLVILTGPPQVSLRSASRKPYDGAIAAARTCYSPRVVDGRRGDRRPSASRSAP